MMFSPLNHFMRDLLKKTKLPTVLEDDNPRLRLSSAVAKEGSQLSSPLLGRPKQCPTQDETFCEFSAKSAPIIPEDMYMSTGAMIGARANLFRRNGDDIHIDESSVHLPFSLSRPVEALTKERHAMTIPLSSAITVPVLCTASSSVTSGEQEIPWYCPPSVEEDKHGWLKKEAGFSRSKTGRNTSPVPLGRSKHAPLFRRGSTGSNSKDAPFLVGSRNREKQEDILDNPRWSRPTDAEESVSADPPARPMRQISHELIISLEETEPNMTKIRVPQPGACQGDGLLFPTMAP